MDIKLATIGWKHILKDSIKFRSIGENRKTTSEEKLDKWNKEKRKS